MFWSEYSVGSLWWLLPLVMMALCFCMMRGRKGSMICGFGSRVKDNHRKNAPDSAVDILDRRYARGEIDKEEYAERKIVLTSTTDYPMK